MKIPKSDTLGTTFEFFAKKPKLVPLGTNLPKKHHSKNMLKDKFYDKLDSVGNKTSAMVRAAFLEILSESSKKKIAGEVSDDEFAKKRTIKNN